MLFYRSLCSRMKKEWYQRIKYRENNSHTMRLKIIKYRAGAARIYKRKKEKRPRPVSEIIEFIGGPTFKK